MHKGLNVLGTALEPCCNAPVTGYFRDGYCRTISEDTGTHIVCAVITNDFLEFTRLKGNDLSTPLPYWNFPGLKEGDKWCLCISRWLQAERAGVAPPIILEAIPETALNYTDIQLLKKYSYKTS
ncbi:DUF2237 family protein [Ascidiimonas sp. W6]|uniref:DUF2237 family protein n=1 Tax=Ascidiimonas meishanensis TaxID=3128903 RepID=UPI0030ED393B